MRSPLPRLTWTLLFILVYPDLLTIYLLEHMRRNQSTFVCPSSGIGCEVMSRSTCCASFVGPPLSSLHHSILGSFGGYGLPLRAPNNSDQQDELRRCAPSSVLSLLSRH